jgi:hypothetical protein
MKRLAGAVAVLACAVALGACGVGAGESEPDVALVVTRDFGTKMIGERSGSTSGQDTVMRYLQRGFDVGTRYGGGFVQSIDGVEGGMAGGRPVDWFFYVNGVEASQGATSMRIRAGDRIWWDHHPWDGAQRSPAVVGSYPEPFVHGLHRRWPTQVECATGTDAKLCDTVTERLREAGVSPVAATASGRGRLRLLVGTWAAVRGDRAARLLADGPRASGIFARFADGGRSLLLLDDEGRRVQRLGAGFGIVAATRFRDQPPTWLLVGTDAAGVEAAVGALGADTLRRHFAVAVSAGSDTATPLPVSPGRQ